MSTLARTTLLSSLAFGLLLAPTPRASAPALAAMPPATVASTDAAIRSVAAREYEATDAGAGLQAPNRANGVRTYFDASGARVVDRLDGAEIARLRTASVGRDRDARPLPDGEVSASGARVEIRRPGLVEWFENAERGLEHGWTLAERPDGDGPLAVEVDFGAEARVDGGRASIRGGGRLLDYDGAEASDANGRVLVARLEPSASGRVRILVDDTTATYPISIDPTLAAPIPDAPTIPPDADVTLQSDQASSRFGMSVAGVGDVNGDGFDDVIVGADRYDAGQQDEGAAFVFHGGPGGLGDGSPTNADAVLQSDQANINFGICVAGAGDVNDDGFADVIVGGGARAFVFHGGPGGVGDRTSAEADATLTTDQPGSQFGSTVDGAGDVNGDGFDDVIVGALAYSTDHQNGNRFGAAFVFHGGPGGVGDHSTTTADGRLTGDQIEDDFGVVVRGAGDVNGDGFDDIIVGSDSHPVGDGFGAAYVFHGSAVGVGMRSAPAANAVLTSGESNSRFGVALDGAGDVNGDGFDDVVVGDNVHVVADVIVGAAFVFHGGPDGIGSRRIAQADGTLIGDRNQEFSNFGLSVAGAGDVDGDHFDDVVVSAPNQDIGPGPGGGAFVFHGSPAGVGNRDVGSADAAYLSDQTGSSVGYIVAGAGDTNGDFSADVIVGAPFYDLGQADEGAAFVFVGPVLAAGSGGDTPGVYAPASGTWFLNNTAAPGPADLSFGYGASASGLLPIKGDWNGDSFDTPGLYDPASGAFFLKNANGPGSADLTFTFGVGGSGAVPLAGDWDNNGTDTVGLYQPATSTFFLTNVNAAGPAALVFQFGAPGLGSVPIAGDWDDNGTDTVGLYNSSTGVFFVRNVAAPGPADLAFQFGAGGAGTVPLAGDYDGDGRDTVGLYQPATGAFFLTNFNAPGPAALVFGYGAPNLTPLVGDWNAI